jgi:uncharacterized caspase-like protein
MRPAPDLQDVPRAALVIGTARYSDGELSPLEAAARDAAEMAAVLADPGIGGFEVTSVIDGTERQIRVTTEQFLRARGRDDLILVYLSGHGVLGDGDRLYFAATDTDMRHLNSTAVASDWLWDRLTECRASRRQVVILDCCNSGAFLRPGSKAASNRALDMKQYIPQGRGRAVITASRARQRSWVSTTGSGVPVSSVFTSALVEGIRTGAADADGDGWISVSEAFDYAFHKVVGDASGQTPQFSMFGAEGDLRIARIPAAPPASSTSGERRLRAIGPVSLRLPAELKIDTESDGYAEVAARQAMIQADLAAAQEAYMNAPPGNRRARLEQSRRAAREVVERLAVKHPGLREMLDDPDLPGQLFGQAAPAPRPRARTSPRAGLPDPEDMGQGVELPTDVADGFEQLLNDE